MTNPPMVNINSCSADCIKVAAKDPPTPRINPLMIIVQFFSMIPEMHSVKPSNSTMMSERFICIGFKKNTDATKITITKAQ